MILVRTTITGNWSGAAPEYGYHIANNWQDIHGIRQSAEYTAFKRTRDTRNNGATGLYYAQVETWDDSVWYTLDMSQLPSIPLPMLKRVLDYVPAYEKE